MFPCIKSIKSINVFVIHSVFWSYLYKMNRIRFAHRVLTLPQLRHSLADPSINFIETDVSTLFTKYSNDVCMVHPSHPSTALKFEEWMQEFKIRSSGHGLKLDFKDVYAYQYALGYLSCVSFPVQDIWLNADVLQGPNGRTSVFDPDLFIQQCQEWLAGQPHGMLSLGYTSAQGPETVYTASHI